MSRQERIRRLCIEKNWFTGGDNDEYEKMFKASHTMPVDAVAAMIYVCSENVEHEEVLKALKEVW